MGLHAWVLSYNVLIEEVMDRCYNIPAFSGGA